MSPLSAVPSVPGIPTVEAIPMTHSPGRPAPRLAVPAVPAVLAVLVATAGCHAVDRSGGEAQRPQTTLVFAQGNGGVPDQLTAWAQEVEKRSNGALHVDFRSEWRAGQPDAEAGTLHDVAAGTVDMAWVGARAFDRAGSTAFQALLAPMLVDSHDLQAAVFQAGIPQDMAATATVPDVHVVGVLPGPMRKVLGIDKAFVRPADFTGAAVGMQDSALTDETLRALGATTKALPSGADLTGVDAYEQQLSSVHGNRYTEVASHYTGNLDLWPRPLVVVAGQTVWDRLDPADRTALDEATRAAIPAALDASRAEDHANVAELCGNGLTLDTVTPADLATFHTALQPVYDRLGGDPATGQWLRRIQEVKTRVAAPADAVTCADGGPAPSPSTIDGTYTAHLDWPHLQPAGCPLGDGESQLVEDYRLVLAGGRARLYISSATSPQSLGFDEHYTVFQDRISLGGENPLSARYELTGDTLTFSDMQGPCGDVTVWTTVPFHRVG
jgi:TRAP-type C4-dicarboxylate transport system substrate-binding protein